jgi:hypothetical protein
LRGSLVFVEDAAEDEAAPDPRLGKIGSGMVSVNDAQ